MVAGRRERLRQELRDEILEAARALFVHEGYGSVSMRKIADTVGCAPGTIYLHFADKAAILSAIVVETFTKLDKRMQAIANDKGDPLERLRRGGFALLDTQWMTRHLARFGTCLVPKAEYLRLLAEALERPCAF